MEIFYMNQEAKYHCIKINGINKRGFAIIAIGHHRGMDQITEEILEEEFVPCTEDYFLKMRENEKLRREENGRNKSS